MRLALTLVLTLGCSPFASEPQQPAPWFHNVAGFVVWNCDYPRPVTFYRSDYAQDTETLRHEAEHVRQAIEAGCDQWNRWMHDTATMDSIEADARARSRIANER